MAKVSTVWPVNELGEVVATSGTGSTNVVGFVSQDLLPIADNGKIPIAGLFAQSSSTGPVYYAQQFDIKPSDTLDQTIKIQNAINTIGANATLIFEAGRYNYNGLISNVKCSLIGVRGKTEIWSTSVDGKNTRWDFPNVSNILISGIIFRVPNKPASPTNNGTEPDCIIRISVGNNVIVEHCEFYDAYGVPVLFRSVTDGVIRYCKAIGSWKDSFHITGLSKRITRAFCTVVDGGDDAFPVVGYRSTGTTGQPEDIWDICCNVVGVKFARAFAYVGAKGVKNYFCTVDGKIPTERFISSTYQTMSGLYISSEGAFDSYGNEDIVVSGMTIKNCGNSPHNSISILGRSGVITDNIRLRDISVYNSARAGLYCDGGTASGITNLYVDNMYIYDTSDPNGVMGTAGAGTGVGMFINNTDNVTIDKTRIYESGGTGVNIGTSCGGILKFNIRTKNINKCGAAGNDIFFVGANSVAKELYIDLEVEDQPQINTSGNPYFIDRIVECIGAESRIRRLNVISTTNFNKAIVTSITQESITVGASPFVFANPTKVPILVALTNGAGITVERAYTDNITTPKYKTPNSSKVAGYYTLNPGESLKVTYSTAPTMSWRPSIE